MTEHICHFLYCYMGCFMVKLKYEKPPPIVMMITAYGDDENYKQAIQFGADDFLTKPIDFTLLLSKLKNVKI